MAENDKTLKKCSRCCSTILLEFFGRNRKGEYYKTCTSCRTRPKCEHGKTKHSCKKCVGCEHGRIKSQCKECGGSQICEHNKVKSDCKNCKGSSICEHNKRKSVCKDCGGSKICEHNRIKSSCKECGGSQICEHKRYRTQCKDCGGSKICEHNRCRNVCKECGGNSICEHNRVNSSCKDCGGSQICEHNKRRGQCKDCGGSQICEHKRHRSNCKDCGGSQICEHNKRISRCIICRPKGACQHCLSVYINPRYRFKPYCFRCYCVLNPDMDIPRKYKIKEHHLRDELKKEFTGIKLFFDTRIDNGCSLRRPDVRIECLTHTVIVECDEEQHKNVSCENKRTMELFQDLGSRPLVMIRFNPDCYEKDNKKFLGCFKTTKTGNLSLNKKEWFLRIKLLIATIKKYLNQIPSKEITVDYLFYNEGSN